jgi:hypothetical protein
VSGCYHYASVKLAACSDRSVATAFASEDGLQMLAAISVPPDVSDGVSQMLALTSTL